MPSSVSTANSSVKSKESIAPTITKRSVSIAPMSKHAKYAEALDRAMEATKTPNLDVAAVAGVGQSNVSHWRNGKRPVPAERAAAVAALLSIAPESISEAYARMITAGALDPSSGQSIVRGPVVPAGHKMIAYLEGFARPVDLPPNVLLPEFVLRRKAGHGGTAKLRWVVNPSKSMEPQIDLGALVIVDSSVRTADSVVSGNTYAYNLWGRSEIRRILIRKDHWSVAGIGKESDLTDIDGDDLASLDVLGEVLGSI